jgi:HSP20 family protein
VPIIGPEYRAITGCAELPGAEVCGEGLVTPPGPALEGILAMALPVRRNRTDEGRDDSSTQHSLTRDVMTEFDRLTQQLSRLFEYQWTDLPSMLGTEGLTPLADLEEFDDVYQLEIELPGIKKKDITIDIDERRVVVSGERPAPRRTGWLRRQNRSWGRFRYEVTLPEPVDEEHAEAKLDDGVLTVRLPKSSTGHHRRVEVK